MTSTTERSVMLQSELSVSSLFLNVNNFFLIETWNVRTIKSSIQFYAPEGLKLLDSYV